METVDQRIDGDHLFVDPSGQWITVKILLKAGQGIAAEQFFMTPAQVVRLPGDAE